MKEFIHKGYSFLISSFKNRNYTPVDLLPDLNSLKRKKGQSSYHIHLQKLRECIRLGDLLRLCTVYRSITIKNKQT